MKPKTPTPVDPAEFNRVWTELFPPSFQLSPLYDRVRILEAYYELITKQQPTVVRAKYIINIVDDLFARQVKVPQSLLQAISKDEAAHFPTVYRLQTLANSAQVPAPSTSGAPSAPFVPRSGGAAGPGSGMVGNGSTIGTNGIPSASEAQQNFQRLLGSGNSTPNNAPGTPVFAHPSGNVPAQSPPASSTTAQAQSNSQPRSSAYSRDDYRYNRDRDRDRRDYDRHRQHRNTRSWSPSRSPSSKSASADSRESQSRTNTSNDSRSHSHSSDEHERHRDRDRDRDGHRYHRR